MLIKTFQLKGALKTKQPKTYLLDFGAQICRRQQQQQLDTDTAWFNISKKDTLNTSPSLQKP